MADTQTPEHHLHTGREAPELASYFAAADIRSFADAAGAFLWDPRIPVGVFLAAFRTR